MSNALVPAAVRPLSGMVMRRHPEAFRTATLVGLLLISLTAACGRRHYLAQYSFSDRSLALVFLEPPAPELLTGLYDLRPGTDPIRWRSRD